MAHVMPCQTNSSITVRHWLVLWLTVSRFGAHPNVRAPISSIRAPISSNCDWTSSSLVPVSFVMHPIPNTSSSLLVSILSLFSPLPLGTCIVLLCMHQVRACWVYMHVGRAVAWLVFVVQYFFSISTLNLLCCRQLLCYLLFFILISTRYRKHILLKYYFPKQMYSYHFQMLKLDM
jgi:hypothetical protein